MAIYRSHERSRYCEKLYHAVASSKSHIREIVRRLALDGLIVILPEKKVKRLVLTKKGRRIAEFLFEIKAELSKL